MPDSNNQIVTRRRQEQELQIISEDCATKRVSFDSKMQVFNFFLMLVSSKLVSPLNFRSLVKMKI